MVVETEQIDSNEIESSDSLLPEKYKNLPIGEFAHPYSFKQHIPKDDDLFYFLILIFLSSEVTGEVEEDESGDADLTQADYDRSIGAESTDAVYVKFMARVRLGGSSQVVRYIQPTASPQLIPPRPLAVCENSLPLETDFIPCCSYCGSPRQFEFQVHFYLINIIKLRK